jgi:hypothetical protein
MLNFSKIFEFPNQNGKNTLVVVTGGEKPKIPTRLREYEILEFKTLDEARRFGRKFVAEFGESGITPHGLNVEDFYKYSVRAYSSSMGVSENIFRVVTGLLDSQEEATRIANEEHFKMQDSVNQCGDGFFDPEIFSVIRHNE